MHDRQTIRTDARDRLNAAGLLAGNIEASRVLQWQAARLPGGTVYTGNQRAERIGGTEPTFRNETELAIEFAVEQSADADPPWDDQLDDLCDQAEQILLTDPGWVNQFERVISIETTISQTADGDRPIASARIEITVQYTTTFEPVVEDALVTIHADWDMAEPRNDPQSPTGPDGQIDATDDLTLPQ